MGLGIVAAMCSVPFSGDKKRRKKLLRMLLLYALLLLFVVSMVACGGGGGSSSGGGNSVTPLNGTVTVTATSGSLNHTVTIPVTIN